jgi:CBS domain-containing protein
MIPKRDAISERKPAMRVRDLATRQVFTIGPDTSVRHAAKLMLKHDIGGLPVVDDAMNLVGIITEGDLLRRFELELGSVGDPHIPDRQAGNAREFVRRHSWKTGDVMTRNVITVDEKESIGRAARLLEEHGIKRLAVTSNGKLTGIISRSDLLPVVARSGPERIAAGDDALRTSIATRLQEVFGARGAQISIAALDGNVRLSGEVASLDERDAARVIVENILGVKAIENDLSLESQS